MKNWTLRCALLAVALGGCTMNGKKMFELGGSSPSSSDNTPVANSDGESGATSPVDSTSPDVHRDEREPLLREMDVAYSWVLASKTRKITGDQYINGKGLIGIAVNCRGNIPKLASIEVKDIELDGKRIPLNQLDAVVCTPLEKIGRTLDREQTAAKQAAESQKAAELEERARPLKAANISGEKLAFILNYGKNSPLYGVGGIKLETPKQLKTARLIFIRVINRQTDRYEIYRTQFDGDKMQSDTRKEYKLDPGIDGFR